MNVVAYLYCECGKRLGTIDRPGRPGSPLRATLRSRGVVRGSEHTFVDDSRWCWMGELSTNGAIASMNPPPVHSLELMLAEVRRNSDGIK